MHSTDLGDHIGMESCIDLYVDTYTTNGTTAPLNPKPWRLNNRRSSMLVKNAKELPPPMPIQTSTVLKRYYTDDGRLIIAEEKVESPKYHFVAHRAHGRLTLRLVDCDGDGDGEGDGRSGGGEKGFRYGAAPVKVAATGPCLLVEQNQHRPIRPVKI